MSRWWTRTQGIEVPHLSQLRCPIVASDARLASYPVPAAGPPIWLVPYDWSLRPGHTRMDTALPL